MSSDLILNIIWLLFGPPFLGELIIGIPVGIICLYRSKRNKILDSEKHTYNSKGEPIN